MIIFKKVGGKFLLSQIHDPKKWGVVTDAKIKKYNKLKRSKNKC